MRVRGRDGTNTPFQYVFDSQAEGLNWIHEFIGSRRYIIQPFLHLTNSKGQPFDVRVLMQKNGLGRWTLTGMAVRLGNQGSLTSNLHGGGTAVSPLPFCLQNMVRVEKTSCVSLLQKLHTCLHYWRLHAAGLENSALISVLIRAVGFIY